MAVFVFTGQDANNTSNSTELVVNNTTPISFTFDSGAENFVGDDLNTGTNEGADDTVSYTNYDNVVIDNASFDISYIGWANWGNGNKPVVPGDESSRIAVITITSGPDSGQKYTIILENPPPDGTIKNGNHHATADPEPPVFCFARDTLIRTPNGDIPIQDLCVGDRVTTAAHGDQTIRWIGSVRTAAKGANQPIRIAKGALGAALPAQDLVLSPAHRILMSGVAVELLFDTKDVLAHAGDLLNDTTIRPCARHPMVEYFHILFDRHEIIFANDAPCESLHPGDLINSASARRSYDELVRLFPQIARPGGYGEHAHPTLSAVEARILR